MDVVDVDDVTGVDVTVVVSDDVVDEIVLAVDDTSLVVEDVSNVVLVEMAVDEGDVEIDAESVESVDIEEEVAVDSVEAVTSVVDVADVDSVGMVDSCEVVDDSVNVELSFKWIVTALVVEALKISPNMDREITMSRVTRNLLDIPSRSLFIDPLFIRCLHLTMSCSWRISEVDESSLPPTAIRNLFPAWKHRELITVAAGR